ncbi:hypothetical protein LEMLEM_LOCUS12753 [Lemmus lemmus]
MHLVGAKLPADPASQEPESTATFSHPRTESVIPKLLDAHKVSLKQS